MTGGAALIRRGPAWSVAWAHRNISSGIIVTVRRMTGLFVETGPQNRKS